MRHLCLSSPLPIWWGTFGSLGIKTRWLSWDHYRNLFFLQPALEMREWCVCFCCGAFAEHYIIKCCIQRDIPHIILSSQTIGRFSFSLIAVLASVISSGLTARIPDTLLGVKHCLYFELFLTILWSSSAPQPPARRLS